MLLAMISLTSLWNGYKILLMFVFCFILSFCYLVTILVQSTDGEIGRVQNELNMSCLRSAVKLLDRLQLTPLDERQGDARHGVSRLFVRYSGILLRGLDIFQLEPPVRLCSYLL